MLQKSPRGSLCTNDEEVRLDIKMFYNNSAHVKYMYPLGYLSYKNLVHLS